MFPMTITRYPGTGIDQRGYEASVLSGSDQYAALFYSYRRLSFEHRPSARAEACRTRACKCASRRRRLVGIGRGRGIFISEARFSSASCRPNRVVARVIRHTRRPHRRRLTTRGDATLLGPDEKLSHTCSYNATSISRRTIPFFYIHVFSAFYFTLSFVRSIDNSLFFSSFYFY